MKLSFHLAHWWFLVVISADVHFKVGKPLQPPFTLQCLFQTIFPHSDKPSPSFKAMVKYTRPEVRLAECRCCSSTYGTVAILLAFLTKGMRGRDRETERRNSHPLLHSPNTCNGQDWSGIRARNTCEGAHVDNRKPVTRVITVSSWVCADKKLKLGISCHSSVRCGHVNH